MATVPEAIERLRQASIQHAGQLMHCVADIKALGADLKSALDRLTEIEAQVEQNGKDIAMLAGAAPAEAGAGEADERYDEDEEDAEFEEAGG